jgi:hypothetical protein
VLDKVKVDRHLLLIRNKDYKRGNPLVQVVMKRYPNLLDGEPACWYPSRCSNRIDGRRSPWRAAANQAYAWSCPLRSVKLWNAGNGRPPSVPDWCAGERSFFSWRLGTRHLTWPKPWVSNAPSYANGPDGL